MPPEVIAQYQQLSRRGKTINRSFSLYPADLELIAAIEEYLGCGGSEVVRTAVRSFAANLGTATGKSLLKPPSDR